MITGYDVAEALEAAHIRPVWDQGTDTTENGLLLRADLHRLFDTGMLRLDVEGGCVRVHLAESLQTSAYRDLHFRALSTHLLGLQIPALIARRA